MDSDSEPEPSSSLENKKGATVQRKKRRHRGKGGIPLDHSLLEASRPKRQRREVVLNHDSDEEDKPWNFHEKERLLEALYRHSHMAYESIAHVVKTKTAKQVERFIEKTINVSCLNLRRRVKELDPERGSAPLELWLSLVQELVMSGKGVDNSKHLTKIIRLIGQNEPMPTDSGFSNLNWKNLYQFISDLLADKAVLHPLSNMESLVLLDMMHSMGDTLHTSDTIQQRCLLDLKYQLFMWQIQTYPKDWSFQASASAVNNDFSSVDFSIKNATHETAQAKEEMRINILNLTSISSSSLSTSTSPSTTSSSATANVSSTSSLSVPVKTNHTNTSCNSTSQPSTSKKSQEENTHSNSNDDNDSEESNDEKDDNYKCVDDIDNFLPKLFSLNPFTIPPGLLHLHPKQLPDMENTPVIIGKKE